MPVNRIKIALYVISLSAIPLGSGGWKSVQKQDEERTDRQTSGRLIRRVSDVWSSGGRGRGWGSVTVIT